MPDYLDLLVKDTQFCIHSGYYDNNLVEEDLISNEYSLKKSILECKTIPIISEIKFSSPTEGSIRKRENNSVEKIAKYMEEGGAVGISILTAQRHFRGNVKFISTIRKQVKIPILMKDIVISLTQIRCGSKIGANAILFIQTLFERNYCESTLEDMINHAHSKGLEVFLEVHTEEEFMKALETNADIIGINNRNLKTLKVDLEITKGILARHIVKNKVIVSESGISYPEEILELRKYGVNAFLIGTAIMKSSNIKKRVNELVKPNVQSAI
jgi:indole-3-glycerol phosphate synthase